ncbi:MAG: DUF547 domain-containing protein [Pseudomonadota bacterium]
MKIPNFSVAPKDRPLSPLRRSLILAGLALPLMAFSIEALFAPSSELWDRWEGHDASSTATVDHSAWTAFLGRYIRADGDGLNRIDYEGVSDADLAALDAYINALEATPISSLNRDEQFAYWVNLYNALTVKVIVDHLPVESILDVDISPGLFANGPWDKKLVEIEGEDVSLNDIEHRILRPIWKDARVHYAVNCASIGCPNLQPMAFTAQSNEALLDAGARAYVNSPRGVQVTDNKLNTSSIYVWFKEDFGGNDAGVLQHLKAYAQPALAAQLADIKAIASHSYDWGLNAAEEGVASSAASYPSPQGGSKARR